MRSGTKLKTLIISDQHKPTMRVGQNPATTESPEVPKRYGMIRHLADWFATLFSREEVSKMTAGTLKVDATL